jgi:hypothetical protein
METTPTMPVDCVSGCGGGSEIFIAAASLVVSLAAAFLALKAWRVSVEQRDMQRDEHKALMHELNARADLEAELHLMGSDDEEQWVESSKFPRGPRDRHGEHRDEARRARTRESGGAHGRRDPLV